MQAKTIVWFTPLLVAFFALGFVIQDLKHPIVKVERCALQAKGVTVQQQFTRHAKVLYRATQQPENDIALQCPQQGPVVFNDTTLLPIRPEQPIELVTKQFTYLPTRYRISLPVVNPSQ